MAKTVAKLQGIAGKLSLADVIVLAGVVGVEQAAKAAGAAADADAGSQ